MLSNVEVVRGRRQAKTDQIAPCNQARGARLKKLWRAADKKQAGHKVEIFFSSLGLGGVLFVCLFVCLLFCRFFDDELFCKVVGVRALGRSKNKQKRREV